MILIQMPAQRKQEATSFRDSTLMKPPAIACSFKQIVDKSSNRNLERKVSWTWQLYKVAFLSSLRKPCCNNIIVISLFDLSTFRLFNDEIVPFITCLFFLLSL